MSITAMKQAIEALNEAVAFREGGRQKAIDAINALRTAIQQATQPAEVTDEQVESCALEAGFSVESTGSIWAVDGYVGTRVDPGLRKFARAILARRPVQVPMTDREIELIDGMIAVQLDHAQRCDAISNRVMAEKQKGWDMERVELLRRIRAYGITAQAKKETP